MSIASEISRIQGLRNTLRTKLLALGLASSSADLEDCVTAVNGIANNGAVSKTLDATSGNQSYSIPAGYHNGSGNVHITLEETKTLTANGTYTPANGKVFSTIVVDVDDAPLLQEKSWTPAVFAQDIVPDDGYDGLSKVSVGAIPDNFKDAKNVSAKSNEVLTGKIAIGLDGSNNKVEIVGTMLNNGAVAPTALNCDGSYTIPAGYHNGSGVVTAASLASQTPVGVSPFSAVTPSDMRLNRRGWINGTLVTGTMPDTNVDPIVSYDALSPVSADINSADVEDPAYYIIALPSAGVDRAGYLAYNGGWIYGTDQNIYLNTATATFTPTAAGGTVTPPLDDYDRHKLLRSVTINPVPVDSSNSFTTNGTKTPASGKFFSSVSINVPTGTARDDTSVTVSGNTVTIPAGLYSSQVTKSIAMASPKSGTITGLGSVAGDTSYTIPAGYHDGTGTVSLTNDILTALQSI